MSNWKPAVIAAIIVVVIGVGAGVVIAGGDDGGQTTTVTEQAATEAATTESTTTDETATDSSATDEATSTTDEGSAPAGATPVATAFTERDLRSAQGNGLDQCVSAGGDQETRSVGGETLTDATIFNVIYQNRTLCDRWLVILPVAEYSRLEIGAIGWDDKAPEDITAEFSIYGDSRGSEPLYTGSFDGPGGADTAGVSLDLSGVDNLILEWKPGEPTGSEFAGDFVRFRFDLDQAYVF